MRELLPGADAPEKPRAGLAEGSCSALPHRAPGGCPLGLSSEGHSSSSDAEMINSGCMGSVALTLVPSMGTGRSWTKGWVIRRRVLEGALGVASWLMQGGIHISVTCCCSVSSDAPDLDRSHPFLL